MCDGGTIHCVCYRASKRWMAALTKNRKTRTNSNISRSHKMRVHMHAHTHSHWMGWNGMCARGRQHEHEYKRREIKIAGPTKNKATAPWKLFSSVRNAVFKRCCCCICRRIRVRSPCADFLCFFELCFLFIHAMPLILNSASIWSHNSFRKICFFSYVILFVYECEYAVAIFHPTPCHQLFVILVIIGEKVQWKLFFIIIFQKTNARATENHALKLIDQQNNLEICINRLNYQHTHTLIEQNGAFNQCNSKNVFALHENDLSAWVNENEHANKYVRYFSLILFLSLHLSLSLSLSLSSPLSLAAFCLLTPKIFLKLWKHSITANLLGK